MKKFFKFIGQLLTFILVFFYYDLKRYGKLIAKDFKRFTYGFQLNRNLSQRYCALFDTSIVEWQNTSAKRHKINLAGDVLINRLTKYKFFA